jgi:hypothetical protein
MSSLVMLLVVVVVVVAAAVAVVVRNSLVHVMFSFQNHQVLSSRIKHES